MGIEGILVSKATFHSSFTLLRSFACLGFEAIENWPVALFEASLLETSVCSFGALILIGCARSFWEWIGVRVPKKA